MNFSNLGDHLAWQAIPPLNKNQFGLERVRLIAERLGLSKPNCRVITIAGTNGKGSCVALLENILLANAYSVATFTSPHLLRYNERMTINKQACSDALICEAFSIINSSRKETPLTYYEYSLLAALWCFEKESLNFILLEVGLGGRFDATNIIDTELAIVTNIDLDHMEYLGHDRESIGKEKAAIFRPKKWAVCGDDNLPRSVSDYASTIQAPCVVLGRDFSYQLIDGNSWNWQWGNKSLKNLPSVSMPLSIAATALCALYALTQENVNLIVSEDSIRESLKKTKLAGRYQEIIGPPRKILDVAHNPAAAALLAEKIQREKITGKLIAVVAVLADKDYKNILMPLMPLVDIWCVASSPGARGLPAAELQKKITQNSDKICYAYDSIEQAHTAALGLAEDQDLVLAFGSFAVVSCVLNIPVISQSAW